MKNLQEAINYTIEQKHFQVTEMRKSHFEDSQKEIYRYLKDEESDTAAGLGLGYLTTWYHWEFLDTYLQKKELKLELFAKSTFLAEQTNKWDYNNGIIYPPYNGAVQFQYATMHLGQMIYLGWWDKATEYGHLLLKMLYGKQYKGWIAKMPHSWFIMELFCKWQGIELDKSKVNYPKDMDYYGGAIANWNTQDIPDFVEYIELLCRYHVSNSDEYDEEIEVEDGKEFFSHEFSSSDYFIFPVEILMWLAIRKKIGLSNGNLSHIGLMQLPINQLPNFAVPYPTDDLVEKCWVKLQKDNPKVRLEL